MLDCYVCPLSMTLSTSAVVPVVEYMGEIQIDSEPDRRKVYMWKLHD